MLVKCNHCAKEINKKPSEIKRTEHNFCSRSCSVSYHNIYTKTRAHRLQRKNRCNCGEPILSNRKYCDKCRPDKHIKGGLGDMTLQETMTRYSKHPRTWLFNLVRSRARSVAKGLGMIKCIHCSYDKHIEIAHIRSIADFPIDTLISVVNDPSNLKPLCPNCHWEFDNLSRTF